MTAAPEAYAPPGPLDRAPSAPAPTAVADLMPLPAHGWGAVEAMDALAEARLALPFAVPDATVVSALTTVVLRSGHYAVKVYPPGTDGPHLRRTTTALAGSRTALLPLVEPIVTSWGTVSVSRWLVSGGPVGWGEVGALLRQFHDDHADADVPAWDPLRRLVGQVEGLPDEVATVLLDARTAVLGAVATLGGPLGDGVVHGDVSPFNVVAGPDGAQLIDLDFVARAPREYDLTSAARRFLAGEIDRQTYAAFCRGYGCDVLTWDGRVVLDRVALLGGVAFRLWDDRRRGFALDWLDDAVAQWRTPL